MELDSNVVIDDGIDHYGTSHKLILEGDQAIRVQTYDAEPYLRYAAQKRIENAGKSWGDGQSVGVIPIPELNQINAKYQDSEMRKVAVLCWLRENPAFVCFDKFLK